METNDRVIVIAADYPTDYDTYFRNRLDNLMKRAVRHNGRFNGLDLPQFQAKVNHNISRLQTVIEGKFTGLLDLMNYVKFDRTFPAIKPDNAHRYFTHAGMITLNGLYLYQYLSENGFSPHIIQNFSLVNIEEELNPKPLAVCISSNFMYLDEIAVMAQKVKEIHPGLPVIVGGLLVKKVLNRGRRISPETMEWIQSFYGNLDQFIIEFKGEETLVQSLTALQQQKAPDQIPNIAFFKNDGQLFFTKRVKELLDMDRSCINWDKIPDHYLRRTVPMTTSRGCSFRCKFCTCWKLCPQVHYKSVEALKKELSLIQQKGFVKHVRFTDDNFTANPGRLRKVLQMMLNEKFSFSWSTYARASSLTPHIVPMMREAGCEFVNMGIESGSQRILDNMGKRLNRDQVIEAIKLLNDNGIFSEGGFILGFPGETMETFGETMDLVNSSRIPYFQPNLFYYSKDMEVAGENSEYGLTGLALTWKHHTMDSVQASGLMVEMIKQAEFGCHEPQVSVWETFRLLRGEGYSPDTIYNMLKLKHDLRNALEETNSYSPYSEKVETILEKFKNHVIPLKCDNSHKKRH